MCDARSRSAVRRRLRDRMRAGWRAHCGPSDQRLEVIAESRFPSGVAGCASFIPERLPAHELNLGRSNSGSTKGSCMNEVGVLMFLPSRFRLAPPTYGEIT